MYDAVIKAAAQLIGWSLTRFTSNMGTTPICRESISTLSLMYDDTHAGESGRRTDDRILPLSRTSCERYESWGKRFRLLAPTFFCIQYPSAQIMWYTRRTTTGYRKIWLIRLVRG